ncbi:MAG: acetyl-CoA carboxylase biotin carboxylase subunit [Candidatus Marinimicrobia bacterium]|nr:acetyl-CoA carboxylase biotin carboxylase subunit [Candidatus Neomarinimicrobiota bacterium]MCF7827950.1 acetyl-CoA carboxylase biotin carboxylase subunit [Candidatus Neomarinimicrobiota bacterium]MCF7879295.1 acetyl-CoA carboxylase biotin carboxylase subunit [Candidatus Neomarinimicrobiota bacterium]
MILKILIANRGEIAHRIIRACHEMDIEAVAVYSTPDRLAPHVLYADEAYHIGKASSESYLRQDKLIDVARDAGCDAVHPGYGFLAENAEFARKVQDAGLIFIGPNPKSIASMGDKIAARKKVSAAGVPIVPGLEEPVEDVQVAADVARDIGFPVLIKAVGGGGGKGMRIVHEESELEKSIQAASNEAKNAFSDPRVYVEKYLEEPHHIEFQILADQHGNVIHLNERECSVQRRYQKIIEESPSPFMTDKLRREMGEAAVEVARACDYVGAGTVECLVDKYRNFYFLEMNTRLQVEHPVTEQITGIDLVKAQIDVANGEELPWSQEEITSQGHAIECRIYAEDARQNFAPSIGTITDMHVPDGFGVRFDGGVYAGLKITTHYDPMIGKLVCWGNSREEAIRRSLRALEEFAITGVKTSLGFCANVLRFGKFAEGKYDTHILEEHLDDILTQSKEAIRFDVPASVASTLFAHEETNGKSPANREPETKSNKWKSTGRERGLQG